MDTKPDGKKKANIDECILLKRAINQNDSKSLTVLYNKYYSHIKRYVYTRISSISDSEDLAQDVFMELCKGHGNYDGSEKPEKYLIGIAKNKILRYLRGRKKTISTADIIDKIQKYQIPADQMEIQELNKTIKEAIEKLPTKTKQSLMLRFIDGLSPMEASKKAGCSLNTYYQRVHSGIKAIKKVENKSLNLGIRNQNSRI